MGRLARTIAVRRLMLQAGPPRIALGSIAGRQKRPVLNRSPTSTTKAYQHEKIHQLTNSRFAGAGWSRDGPTANAGRIAATKQKTGTRKKAAGGSEGRSAACAEPSAPGREGAGGDKAGEEGPSDAKPCPPGPAKGPAPPAASATPAAAVPSTTPAATASVSATPSVSQTSPTQAPVNP